MAAPQEQYALPISSRPWRTFAQLVNMVLAMFTFLTGCIMIDAAHLMFLLPLSLLPFSWAQKLFSEGVRYNKGAFGLLTGMLRYYGMAASR